MSLRVPPISGTRQSRMLIRKLVVTITIVLLLYIFFLFSPASFSGEEIRFVINPDTKQEEIYNRLKNEKIIRSTRLFTLLAGLIRFPGTVEPGAYNLSRRMTLFSVADTLMNHPYQKWITLVPGLRVEQTAEKLKTKFNWDQTREKEFLDNAREGYMFPDTYLLNVDYTGKEFAQRLINNFNEKFDAQLQKDLLEQNIKSDTAIKIASLIERESGGDEDKALIAGIIWNRLLKDMKLQIDAVAQYALGKPSDWWPHVSPADLKKDSLYNTYLYKGLPPTPICSPSLASIKAVAYPQETDCFFYLHDRGKNIHCSTTYEEHLENIETYLK